MSRKTGNILAASTGALGLFLAIGVRTFLHPCLHADGTEAVCAGAGNLLFYLSLALALVSAGTVWTKGKWRRLFPVGMLLLSLLVILAPGVLQPLCGMDSMRCRMVTQPAARVVGVIAAVLSVFCLLGAVKGKEE